MKKRGSCEDPQLSLGIKNSRGQLTLYIIIGLIIVGVILLVMALTGNLNSSTFDADNPSIFVEACMKNSLKEVELNLFENNFYTDAPKDNYFVYNTEKIPFLCNVGEFYLACIPQDPAMFSRLQNIITNKLSRDTEICIQKLRGEYGRKGFSSQIQNSSSTQITLVSGSINAVFEKSMVFEKGDSKVELKKVESNLASPLFDLVKTATAIVNYESTYCEFNDKAWTSENPEILINRFRTSDQTKVYTLQDRTTEKKAMFAIKTCVLPAGI